MKSPIAFFTELEKKNNKIHIKAQSILETNMSNSKEAGGVSDLKTQHRATLHQTAWLRDLNRYTG